MLTSTLKLTLAPIVWGGAFIAGRLVAAELPPLTITWLRFLLVSVFLLPALRFYEGRLPIPNRRDWILLTLLSLTGVVMFNLLLFQGLKTVTAARSAVLISLAPSVVAVALIVFYRESPHRNALFGIMVAFAGAVVTITNGSPARALAGGVAFGDACLLGSAISWAAYTIIARPALRRLSALAVLSYSSLIGALLLTPFALQGNPAALLRGHAWSTWGSLLYLSWGAAGLAYLWYYMGIRDVGPGRAAVFMNLEPVSGMAFGVLLLGERVTWPVLAGAVMVIGGLYLVNRPVAASGKRAVS